MKHCTLPTGGVALILLAGCASTPLVQVPEMPVVEPLPAMDKYAYESGTKFFRQNVTTGEASDWWITDVSDEGAISGTHNSGCSFTFNSEWFEPVTRWDNCGNNPEWRSGTHSVTEADGSLWPLEVGKRAAYTYTNRSHTGQTGGGTRECEVTDMVRTTVPMGEFDTYKVECRDGDRHWTWYWSPEVGEVRLIQTHTRDGIINNDALVRIGRVDG